MFDAARAVELLVGSRSPKGSHVGYGSGYVIGKGLILTCSHIFYETATSTSASGLQSRQQRMQSDIVARDIRANTYACRVEWANTAADLALVSITEQSDLPSEPVTLGILPSITTGASLNFTMYGWPRAGDVIPQERVVREPFEVHGEIRLSEFVAAKTGRIRLRPNEQFDPSSKISNWTGMSGAAVVCGSAVVAVEVSQPQQGLPAYLSAQPLTLPALSWLDASGVDGLTLLNAASVQVGAPVATATTPDLYAPSSHARASRPYLLLETEAVIGRDIDRNAMEAALINQTEPFYLLVGIGGIGKSALAWDVWERMKYRRKQSPRQFWYSFYDGRGVGNFDAMLAELAIFLNIAPPQPLNDGTNFTRDYIADVLQALDEEKTLLVLDGLERCLRCYQRPLSVGDIEAIRADQTDTAWNEQDLAFANPEAFRLFASLLRQSNCRIIATSRVVPSELVNSGGAPRAGLHVRHLKGLETAGTAALLSAFGMDVTRVQAVQLAASFGGHPLALSILARRFSRSTSARRDLSLWLASQGYLESDGSGPAEVRSKLFASELSQLSSAACKALAVIGVVGGLAAHELIADLLPEEGILTDEILAEINNSGLGTVTPARDVTCHALVSQAALDVLDLQATETLLGRLQIALARRFQPIGDTPLGTGYFEWFIERGTTDRVEAMALCRTLIRVGRTKDASDLYQDELRMALRWSVAANTEAVELLESIVRGLSHHDGRRHRADFAHHLLLSGRLDEAFRTLGDTIDVDALWPSELLTASHLALLRGDLPKAIQFSTKALHLALVDLNYAWGYDYGFLQLMVGKNLHDLNRPMAALVEAACASMRALVMDGWQAEAARIWLAVDRLWARFHDQCSGCAGLLTRTGAEIVAKSEGPQLVQQLLDRGAALQASQGKTLQGIFSHIILASESGRENFLNENIKRMLVDGGLVLYELILEASLNTTIPDDITRKEAAIRSLTDLGCGIRRLSAQASGGDDPSPMLMNAGDLADSTAWTRFGSFRIRDLDVTSDESEQVDAVLVPDDQCREVMRQIVAAARSDENGDEPTREASRNGRADTLRDMRAELDQIDLPCADEDSNLTPEGEERNMRRRLRLNPCDGHALLHLAEQSLDVGDIDGCVDRLYLFLRATETGFENYQSAVNVAVRDDAVASQLMSVLQNFAADDHDSSGAYLALANLHWAADQTVEALRAHSEGSRLAGGLLGQSSEFAHQCALFIFGESAVGITQNDEMGPEAFVNTVEAEGNFSDASLSFYPPMDLEAWEVNSRMSSVDQIARRFYECVRDGTPDVVEICTSSIDVRQAEEVDGDELDVEQLVRVLALQCVRVLPLADRVRAIASSLLGD